MFSDVVLWQQFIYLNLILGFKKFLGENHEECIPIHDKMALSKLKNQTILSSKNCYIDSSSLVLKQKSYLFFNSSVQSTLSTLNYSCNTVQYSIVQYSTVKYSTEYTEYTQLQLLYSTIQ